jgi:hypothetical protein
MLAAFSREALVRWRSGNAAVCKTAMSGFDSRPHIQTGAAGEFPAVPT